MKSNRIEDSKAEKEVAKFLDKNLYKKEGFLEFTRFDDKENQLKGKDVSFKLNNKEVLVDEKAQTTYVNKNLPTFAFEIDFLRSGNELTEGWLYCKDKETEYYMLVWIEAKKERDFVSDDITNTDCVLIKREDLIIFLYDIGLTIDEINKKAQEIRKNEKVGKTELPNTEDCYLYYSPSLAEKPVNLVIRKHKLLELATQRWNVKKE